ncbi:MAG: hypothetical protein NUV73_01880, partial [Candidatus Daviesbacteria bacterium]|nr:hypothetical protein [Candidatus Daviesbacteria bacterium]
MKKFYLHPFLFAIYALLFLYSQNQNFFREEILIIPLLLTLALAGIIYLISLIIFRKIAISALFCSFVIFVFFSYSRIKELTKEIQHSDRFLSLIILLSMAGFIYLLLRYKRYLSA